MTSSNKVKSLLPFDPKTEEYKSYVLDIDVNIASYILNYHILIIENFLIVKLTTYTRAFL